MTAEIAAEFQAAGLGLGVDVSTAAVLGRLADELARQRRRAAPDPGSSLRFVPIQPQAAANPAGIGALLLSNAEIWGPKTGYFWAVQVLRVCGLAANDSAIAYRGNGANAVQLNNQLSPPLTQAAPLYNPGRTDLILQPGDYITVAGTGLTSVSVAAHFDVIVGTLDQLHDFLM